MIAAFFVGYAYERHLAAGLPLWATGGAALVFMACSVLHVFFSKNASRRAGFILLETAALFLPFFAEPWQLLLGAAAVMFLLLLWGHLASRSELNYGTELRFFKVTHAVAAKIVTALLLFTIFFFVVMRAGTGNFFVSESSFSGFFEWGAGAFADFYPGIAVDGSFQSFAESVVGKQLSGNAAFASLAPGAQAAATQGAVASLTVNFSRALGVPIAPSSTVSGVVYDFIVTSLGHWHDRFGIWFVVAWSLVLFVILRSVGIVFIVIAQFFAMILYEILLAAGIARVVERPQTKEDVEFA